MTTANFEIVQLPDGTWMVRNNDTWSKTHSGYFATRELAEIELASYADDGAADDCCPECGHPKDGSSGHGTCDNPCHGAA